MLADMGAEVIKIEERERGDYIRWMPPFVKKESAYFLSLNRNKQSIKLNLKLEKGKEIFLKLAEQSDVIIEGNRPGVMAKLGLDYERIRKINPGIIYCSLSGYGQSGPYRDKAGHDINYISLGGILYITGEKNGSPVIPGVQIADQVGGMYAAISILLALIAREKIGKGQYLDVSMLDGVVSWMTTLSGKFFADGLVLNRGELELSGALACYNVYKTKDGKYLSLGALEDKFWKGFCQAVGYKHYIEKQFDWGAQEEIKNSLDKLFLKRTRDEWLKFFKDRDICCEPINQIDEVFSHPQIKKRKLVREINHPTEGKIRQIIFPIIFSETPAKIKSPPPRFGEHTEEVLARIGFNKEEIKELKKEGII